MNTRDERIYHIFVILIVVTTAIISFYPLVYVIATSLVTADEFDTKGGIVLWPSAPTLIAYINIFDGTSFVDALKISVFRTVVGTLLTLGMTTIVAYVASRDKMPGRNLLITFVLLTILFNGGLIPTFLVVRDLHLLDSVWSMIIPTLVDSFSVLVLKQFFENVPEEIEDSANMDGTGEIQLMVRILVPMAAPAMAAIGLFMAVYHWNAWFDALVYINDSHKLPLQMVIRSLVTNANDYQDPSLSALRRVSPLSAKMAVVTLATIPILCLYPFLQKYFTKGMFLGAVKG